MFNWKKSAKTAAPELRVLMVCMGNICRSPSAEAVLRHKLEVAGLAARVEVDSAGTYGGHEGEPPDPRAVRVGLGRGYALAGIRARRVRAEDFSRYDRILAMDRDNLAALRDMAPKGGADRLALLMDHAHAHAGIFEVPDPYYGPPQGFDRVLDMLEDACGGLVDELSKTLGEAQGTS
ncbi:MAG: low molecular weight protein-tyrosine-phosphatase [Rubrivivax sp.]|nr:low molecular weight protein-tyrosine-phosphatase [Rubrivivax sp.]MDP3086118.1 low molecular weight protein-tyrosine-phosphatase [Rubrivivax sp.]